MDTRHRHPAPAQVWQGEIPEHLDPAVEALVRDIIGKVADKWTMLILEALHEKGTLRYTQLRRLVGGISQKMLTQTVRRMEEDGRNSIMMTFSARGRYSLSDRLVSVRYDKRGNFSGLDRGNTRRRIWGTFAYPGERS